MRNAFPSRWHVAFWLAFTGVGAWATVGESAERQELHVSVSGADEAPGTAEKPLRTLIRAVKLLNESGRVVLRAGTYPIPRRITLDKKGVTISGAPGESVVLEAERPLQSVFRVTASEVTIEGLTIDGKFVDATGAIRGLPTSTKLTLRDCDIRNFTQHVVDIDGDDSLIEHCHIHHALWMKAGERHDAHGIVTEYCKRLKIDGCEVHHVSGDTFQAGRGKWQDIVIVDCDFWDGPLESDMAGFKAGTYAAENAIDTKLDSNVERGRMTLKNCQFHGFRSTLIGNSAALNLKENADVVVDGCVVSGSTVGLRLRGTHRGGVWPTVVNCAISDCDVGIRHEDNLENFRLVHNTLARCRSFFVRAPSRSKIGAGWVVANNLLIDIPRFPDEVRSASNQALLMKNADPKTLRPKDVERMRGEPVKEALPPWYGKLITVDQAGAGRSPQRPVMGAFERPAESVPPGSPD